MNIIDHVHDYNSLDCWLVASYILNQAVGWSSRVAQKTAPHEKEMTMRSHGHATVWGTHIGVGRANENTSWYQHLKEWWAARTSRGQQAKLAGLHACWDAEHEAVKPRRAEAAIEMAIAHAALSMATHPYSLSQ